MEKIAIIGIGRLGLCLALNLEKVGYQVVGVDTNSEHVLKLNTKKFQTTEPFVNEFLKESTHFIASTKLQDALQCDVLFIVVPTPSQPNGEFNHKYIDEIIKQLTECGKQITVKHLVINSTCMPGYCDSVKQKLADLNYTLSYNPEFIAQGSIIKDQQYPDQVLIGETNSEVGDVIQSIYTKLCKNTPTFCRMNLLSAEITKLATNCFLTTKITFANIIGDIAESVGAETNKILSAIGSDSRIGEKYFKYGFGYGGPCFTRDNKAFLQFAKNNNSQALVIEATDKSNDQHHNFLLMQYQAKYSKNEEIIFDSVTYKKGSDILEESQQLKLAIALANTGYKVIIKESSIVIKMLIDTYSNLFTYQVNEK